jgi:hypothetical protein
MSIVSENPTRHTALDLNLRPPFNPPQPRGEHEHELARQRYGVAPEESAHMAVIHQRISGALLGIHPISPNLRTHSLAPIPLEVC